MGALTVTTRKRTGILPTGKAIIADIALSSSYATGGDTYTAANFGMTSVDAIILQSNAAGYNLSVDLTNSKVLAYQGDNTNAAAAPGIQVPAATNLSAVTVRALVIGDLSHV